MNDIEKQIEDSFKDDSLKKEDDNINNRINHRGNKDKNKKIIYILLFLAIIIIISLIVYLMINKRNNLVEDNKPIENKRYQWYLMHIVLHTLILICPLL